MIARAVAAINNMVIIWYLSSNTQTDCLYYWLFTILILRAKSQRCSKFLKGENKNIMLRYFNFEANFKLRWCRVWDQKFQWPQEGLSSEYLAYEVIT